MLKSKSIEDINFATILNGSKKLLEAKLSQGKLTNLALADSDPAMRLLEISGYKEGLLRNTINKSIEAVMVDYSMGADLDNLGRLFAIERKLIKEADNSKTPVIPAIYEADTELRKRIKDAPKGFSVAGPKASYEHYGKLASDKVKDVVAISNKPMEIEIMVLSYEGNGSASEAIIKAVKNKLSAEDIRPMGDLVTVKSAIIKEFNIELEVRLRKTSLLIKHKNCK
ncbi:Baseplate J-like protein [Candidatus Hepatincolaceae symbiont of Richtersius coronifer]